VGVAPAPTKDNAKKYVKHCVQLKILGWKEIECSTGDVMQD
jgi:hypothetical protein